MVQWIERIKKQWNFAESDSKYLIKSHYKTAENAIFRHVTREHQFLEKDIMLGI